MGSVSTSGKDHMASRSCSSDWMCARILGCEGWGVVAGPAGHVGASTRPRLGTGSPGPARLPCSHGPNLLQVDPGLAINALGLFAWSGGPNTEVSRMSSSRTGQLNYKEQVHYSFAERVFVLSEPVTNKKGETVIIFSYVRVRPTW